MEFGEIVPKKNIESGHLNLFVETNDLKVEGNIIHNFSEACDLNTTTILIVVGVVNITTSNSQTSHPTNNATII